jgi:soluble lytic murein transglycosylase-like protein
MNNGPALIVRGALFGCVVVYLLVSLIQSSTTFEAALAAAEQTSAQPSGEQTTNTSNDNGSLTNLSTEEAPLIEPLPPVVYNILPDGSSASDKNDQPVTQGNTNPTNSAGCAISTSYPPSIQQWCELISAAANTYGLSANLLAALILQESGGQAQAYSNSGAVGLMQVMPRDGIAAEFQCPSGPCFASRPTIAELEDPAYNIDYGTNYLAGLVEKRGSVREALFAYGPMNVGYTYADKVLGIYAAYGGE